MKIMNADKNNLDDVCMHVESLTTKVTNNLCTLDAQEVTLLPSKKKK